MSRIKPIFLYQPDIADYHETRRRYVDFKKAGLQGKTELIERFPEQVLDFSKGQCRVIANAVLYSAKIRRCKEKPAGAPNQFENAIFVDGGIDIYGSTAPNRTPEVSIAHMHGRLWFAIPRVVLKEPLLLEEMIFLIKEDPALTVRRIAEGYRIQQQKRETRD